MRPARRKPSRRRGLSAAATERPARTPRPESRPSNPTRNLRRTVAELRRGREAVSDIEGQLGELMALLRDPVPQIDAAAPERLAGAARQADRALSALADLRRLFP
jgi:hypothetical protein